MREAVIVSAVRTPLGSFNGSLGNIAGIANEAGNVVGMMPHPERSVYPAVSPYGTTEGLLLLKEFTKSLMVRGG